ncbi:MAG: hypothetical protein P1V36_10720 [Planctomycetota bacterium]|nr:hypothetical protein [Planctomycetota bacterium]
MFWFKVLVVILLAAWLCAQLRAVGSYAEAKKSGDWDGPTQALLRQRVVRQMWIGVALVVSSGIAAVLLGVPLR